MEKAPEGKPFPLIEDPSAPDIYADGVAGWFLLNGNLRITLVSTRVNHISNPGPASHAVVGRLIMSEVQAEIMARGIIDFIEKQRATQSPSSQSSFTVQ